MMNIGERLKKLREERKLRKVDVARRAGINPDAYSRWESGDRQPHITNLPALAKALETDYNGLLGGYASVYEVRKEIEALKNEWERELEAIKEK